MNLKSEPKAKFTVRNSIKELCFCSNEAIFLAVSYDTILLYDRDLQGPRYTLKMNTSPRGVVMSPCGKYFCVHESSNEMYLYETETGSKIQKVLGSTFSVKSIKFSGNSRKMIYGSTQIVCLWNILMCSMDMRTEMWRNVNCYDINYEGNQFALGTYNGGIYVLDFIQRGKCNQIEIKRHKQCIVSLCFHKDSLISISHDGCLLLTSIDDTNKGEKVVKYLDLKLQYVPRELKSVGENFYLMDTKGMTWLTPERRLVGFTDGKSYYPILNENKELVFVMYHRAGLEWWDGRLFKPVSEVEKENRRVTYRVIKG